MRILFILENYIPHIGGVEVVFKNLSERLAKQGHEIDIITHQLKGTKKEETVNGVKIHRVPCFNSRYWFTFLAIPKAINLAKKADIIHTTTYNGALPARLAAIAAKKPCLITVHEVLGKNWKTFEGMSYISAKLHEFLEKRIMSLKFDCFVSVSKSTEKNVLESGVSKAKSVVVYNGVDYDFFNPKKYNGQKIRKKFNLEKNFVYFFYGRPGVSKGFEYLLNAVPAVSERISNSKLFAIVSKDKAYMKRYESMKKLIKELNIENKVILHDPVPHKELPNYIKAADCVVVPSLTEGFGFTAAESCAMNIPIVASNAGSLPEVVSGKYVLVEPKNSLAIADGVEKVYKKKVKNTAKKIFKWSDNVKGYLDVYKKLLKQQIKNQ